jgi:hypothetical protein
VYCLNVKVDTALPGMPVAVLQHLPTTHESR